MNSNPRAARSRFLHLSALILTGLLAAKPTLAADNPPAVGDQAPEFKLSSLDGGQVELAQLRSAGPIVLVVLRGYPGYQCPICTRQVGELLAASSKFKTHGATVVLVYPGPSANLKDRASEFITGKTLPANFHLALDPDYEFTNAYHLRWNAKNETAYPSTFVISPMGKIKYAKISMNHGGRAQAEEILAALAQSH
jgi:thioredoxin-dependent peroxiredoxin